MRHQKSGNRLGVNSAHKRAIVRNLVTSLLEHGRITTTLARAKEIRGEVDHMVTLGKRGDLHARRQALSFVKNKAAMANLFGDVAERFKERQGGYTRIIQTGFRRGDGAQQAMIVLVGDEKDPLADAAKPAKGGAKSSKRGRRASKTGKTVAEDVAAEVSASAAEEGEAKPKRTRKKKEEAAEE